MRSLCHLALAAAVVLAPACSAEEVEEPKPSAPSATPIPEHEGADIDARRKEGPRLLVAETYLRSYLELFRGLSPEEVERAARGAEPDELFSKWTDHLGAIGLPDHGIDIARARETNTLMLGAYERLAVALCDREAQVELGATDGPRSLYAFALAADARERAGFDTRFDILHRTLLGYPAALAPGRADRFHALYIGVLDRHEGGGATASKLAPAAAAWAAVCQGLVRHPEFHLY
jgi:hypothetical protein